MNTSDYWVTIAVPFYNVEDYIERCARSLFEQTYQNIAFLFVDDGSSDRSKEVLQTIIKDYPQREPHVHIYSFLENKGLCVVRNFLVDNCQTEWIIYMDSDDWIETDLVEALVKKQKATGADMVVSGAVYHRKEGDFSERNYDSDQKEDYLRLVISNWRWTALWGRLIRLSLYTDHQLRLSEENGNAEDLRLIVPLTYYSNRIVWVRENGYHHDNRREGKYTEMRPNSIHKLGTEILGSLSETRSFVEEKMKEYLELYDTTRCMAVYEGYLTLSLLYGDRELYQLMRNHHQGVVRRYPSIHGSIGERLKRLLKYNYWIARILIRIKFSLVS